MLFTKNRLKLIACLGFFGLNYVWGSDGTVEITGKVVEDGTCVIETNSQNQTIILPTVSTLSLQSWGNTAGQTPFSIKLTKCLEVNYDKVKLSFAGLGVIHNVLSNTAGENAAVNVGLQVIKPNNSNWKLWGKVKDEEKVSGTGLGNIQPQFDYIVQYYATGNASPGNVQAVVKFEIVYD